MATFDIELFTTLNFKIAEIQRTTPRLDLVITQDDKYRNTRDESIIIGLASSDGIKTKEYYFNAVRDFEDGSLVDRYYNEPVYYYEKIGAFTGAVEYEIIVDTMRRRISIYSIAYSQSGGELKTISHLEETVQLPKGKLQKKLDEYSKQKVA